MRRTTIISEIGLCHDGSIKIAKRLIDVSAAAGCDFVKFQTRTPEEDVPKDQWHVQRVPPWGGPAIDYIDYKRKIEFTAEQYQEIDEHCKDREIQWSSSAWGVTALKFLSQFDLPWIKVPSAKLTSDDLVQACCQWAKERDKKVILSLGMSTVDEIEHAVGVCQRVIDVPSQLILLNCNSSYPAKVDELNLSAINYLKKYNCEIGWSGHEEQLGTSVAAIYLGYSLVERHITYDRTLTYGDHKSAVSMHGMFKLVSGIRELEKAYGDGIPKVYDSELPSRKKLRGV